MQIVPDMLGNIVAAAFDLALVIDEGDVIDGVLVERSHPTYDRFSNWVGQNIRQTLTTESIPKFDRAVGRLHNGTTAVRPVELNHHWEATVDLPIEYTLFRLDHTDTSDQPATLLLGRDLRPVADIQQQLIDAQIRLERDYEAQRDIDTRFRVLLETTRDAVAFVSAASGRILELNARAADLLGAPREDLVQRSLAQEFEGRRRGELIDTLVGTALSEAESTVELRAKRSRRDLNLSATLFRVEGGRMILCRLEPRDLERDRPNSALDRNLRALFRSGADGIACFDMNGSIYAANDAFLALVEVADMSLLSGRLVSEFFTRGGADLKVLVDNASRTGRLPIYATRMVSALGNEFSVELSATHVASGSPALVVVARNADRAEAVRRPGMYADPENQRGVIDLVGSTSMKKIVADAADIVEKMCIETAIELTGNNRVATAEMLGLSRQSLYVKLRKYGLIDKDND